MTDKTMTVHAKEQTLRDVDFLTLHSDEFHVTVSINETGQLVLQAVSGLLLISPQAIGKVLVITQPFQKQGSKE